MSLLPGRNPTHHAIAQSHPKNLKMSDDQLGAGPFPTAVTMALPAAPVPTPQDKNQTPQDFLNEFWENFSNKDPTKISTVLPGNLYAESAAKKQPKGKSKGETATANYEDAVRVCKEKVAQISKECRRINQKYRDLHFDIDLNFDGRFCLDMLYIQPPWQDGSAKLNPGSVARVGDIFEEPVFFKEGATAGDIQQGRDGDCWLMAAVTTLCNMPGLIERVCVAKDEDVGVYGFVFHRDGEWISTLIDDKLYLTKPKFEDWWEY